MPIFTAAAHHLLKITTPSAPRTTTKKHTQVLPHWAKGKKKLLLQFLPKFLAPTNFYLMRGAAKTQDSCCILCLLEQAVSNADFFREETGIFLYRLEPSLPLLIFSPSKVTSYRDVIQTWHLRTINRRCFQISVQSPSLLAFAS